MEGLLAFRFHHFHFVNQWRKYMKLRNDIRNIAAIAHADQG